MNVMKINVDNFERVLSAGQSKQTTQNDILQSFDAVFSYSLGTLHGEAHLSADKAVRPVIPFARNIPVSLLLRSRKSWADSWTLVLSLPLMSQLTG